MVRCDKENFSQSRKVAMNCEIIHQLAQRTTEHMLALPKTRSDLINMIINPP